jgi:hypothetical protein
MERKYRARAQLDHSQLGESLGGTPRVEVAFNFLDEHEDGIVYMGYLTPKTLERTVKDLRTMGWKGNNPKDLKGIDTNEVELIVDNEEYKGKMYPKVKWVNSVKGEKDSAKMQSRADAIAKRIAALEVEGKEEPEEKNANVAGSDEDVPF